MTKRIIVLLMAVLFAFMMIGGCGEIVKEAPDGTGNVEGTVYAPDGTTPISAASVSSSGVSTTTNDAGFFRIELPAGTRDILIRKGVFSATVTGVNVVADTTITVGGSTGILLETTENIAVVTGAYDRMEDVLAKLGYGDVDSWGELIPGTEDFDLIDGDNTLDASHMDFDDFITSPEAIAQYSLIFINCGNDYEGLMFSDPTVIDNIQNYVDGGGKLYVTDLSYDFVEQAFPGLIDFYGDPGEWDAAEVGSGGITTDAEILDSNLSTWLSGRSALNPDETVHIGGFLSSWAVMDGAASGTKIWIRGEVEFAGTSGVKPLTATFDYGTNGGRVLYSSYHTEDAPDPSLRPQEYILAYLIFEL